MILGFSHLTINTNDLDKTLLDYLQKGWVIENKYKRVRSSKLKHPLMKNNADFHDILILDGNYKIELISHNINSEGNKSDIINKNNHIRLNVLNKQLESIFFKKGLGYIDIDDRLHLISPIKKWKNSLMLVEDHKAKNRVMLDYEGCTCLAFHSTNPENDSKKLIELGASEYTGVFKVSLGDKRLLISMLRSPNGNIIELVKYIK